MFPREIAMKEIAVPLVPEPVELHWRRRMLIVGGNLEDRRLLVELASAQEWGVVQARSFGDAEGLIHRISFDCFVSEVVVDGENVLRFVSYLAAGMIISPILLIGESAASRELAAQLAQRIGLNVCYPMAKPLTADVIARRLARIDQRLNDGLEGCCHRDCHCSLLSEAPG